MDDMTPAQKIAQDAWNAFSQWERVMSDRFAECFDDVDLLTRVDIYGRQDHEPQEPTH